MTTNLKAIARQYPIDKPRPSVQLVFLAAVTTGGLIALFFAAFNSFTISTGNAAQAFFAAILIEVGLAVEALALIKRPRSIFPWVGLVAAFIVSGTYNWYQAQIHAQATGLALNEWTLGALAFGPLIALAFVSLTLGYELSAHQGAVSAWAESRAQWAETERKRADRRAERERKRAETSGKLPESVRKVTGKLPETKPVWLGGKLPESYHEFSGMVKNGEVSLPQGLTGRDLQEAIPAVGTDKTGRNWLRSVGYRNGETNHDFN